MNANIIHFQDGMLRLTKSLGQRQVDIAKLTGGQEKGTGILGVFKNTFGNLFKGVISSAKIGSMAGEARFGGIGKVFGAARGGFSGLRSALKPKALLGAGKSMIGAGLTALGPQMLALTLVMKPLSALLEGLMEPLEPLIDIFGMVGQILGLLLVPIVQSLMEVLLPFMPLLTEIVVGLMPLIRIAVIPLTLMGKLLQFFIPVLTAFMNILNSLFAWVTSFLDRIEAIIDGWINGFVNIVNGFRDWARDWADEQLDRITFWREN
jgi:phage-related protein